MKAIKYLTVIILLISVLCSCANSNNSADDNTPPFDNNQNSAEGDGVVCIPGVWEESFLFETEKTDFSIFLETLQKCATNPAELEKYYVNESVYNGETIKWYDIGYDTMTKETIISDYNLFKDLGCFAWGKETGNEMPNTITYSNGHFSYSYVTDNIMYNFYCHRTTPQLPATDYSSKYDAVVSKKIGEHSVVFYAVEYATKPKVSAILCFDQYWMNITIVFRTETAETVDLTNFNLDQFVWMPFYEQTEATK